MNNKKTSPCSILAGIHLVTAVALTLFFTWPIGAGAQKGKSFGVGDRSVNIDSFNTEVNRMMQYVGVPGMSLAVIDHNKIVYYGVYGVKRRGTDRKVDKKTVFEGCSLSKSLLVPVAYELVDEGKLDLDKPMYEYLPNKDLAYDERYKLITPRMVLSHSSGLENWRQQNNPNKLEIINDPGTKYGYSGEGYQYLAAVIERILGKSYEEYITERVIRPLKLKNTYLKYRTKKFRLFHKESPWDYAKGHAVLGKNVVNMYNTETVPAAGNHFTAEDYAKLILGIFDGSLLHDSSIKQILTPVIRIANSHDYYGTGFEVVSTDSDLIIAHGGDNPGFKNQMFYSYRKKRGIIFMANSDRGKSMDVRLNVLTTRLCIDSFLQLDAIAQYPDTAFGLLKVYDEEGRQAMEERLAQLVSEGKIINANTLADLSMFFIRGGQKDIAKELQEEGVKLFPDSAILYVHLGELNLQMNDQKQAFANLTKAKMLHFRMWDLDPDFRKCEDMRKEREWRDSSIWLISDTAETKIRAEYYHAVHEIEWGYCKDQDGGGKFAAYYDSAEWMDYRIDVRTAGNYEMTFQVASVPGRGRIDLWSDVTALTSVPVKPTGDWQKWEPEKTTVNLHAGLQTLKLYSHSGGFNLNWIKFSPIKAE